LKSNSLGKMAAFVERANLPYQKTKNLTNTPVGLHLKKHERTAAQTPLAKTV
jgi:hypothetical protein